MSKREAYEFAPAADGAKQFWKSLDEKADPEAAEARKVAEFPLGAGPGVAGVIDTPVSRRGMLSLGAIVAALAAEGCARRPVEKIFPYSKNYEAITPGIANHYATVRYHRGEAIGLLVESHEGRPTKIEGNPDHSASLGSSDLLSQASLFDLYDPDRSRSPMRGMKSGNTTKATFTEVDALLADVARQHTSDQGLRLRILMEPTSSPTLLRVREAVLARFRQAKVYTYASVNESNAREGARLAFGQAVVTVPDYAKAQVVVALDSDFLGTEGGNIRATRGFSASRRVTSPKDDMSRLYVVEPSLTITGMNADHRLRLLAGDCERYLKALVRELSQKHGVDLGPLGAAIGEVSTKDIPDAWIKSVAKELGAKRRASIVTVGSRQPARVHALAHALNHALGNVGSTISYFAPADATERDNLADIRALAAEMEGSKVGTLVILGGNPVYDAPSDLKFGERLRAVDKSIHLATHEDETSAACAWHIPQAHELETWGDQRSRDGSLSIQQPLIAPLHNGRSALEILARLTPESNATAYDLVRATRRRTTGQDPDRTWDQSVRLGVVSQQTAPAFGAIAPRTTEIATALTAVKDAPHTDLEVTFSPCPKLFDGRNANNMWLLELPDPVSKVSWDNVAYVSPATAKQLDLKSQQMVRLTRDGAKPLDIAVWILPGQADGSIALTLGWGRQITGRYGKKHGFDVHPLRTSEGFYFANGVKLEKLDGKGIDAMKDRVARPGLPHGPSPAPGRVMPDDPFEVETNLYKISQTQEHNSMEGRPLAIDTSLAEYKATPTFVQYKNEKRGRRAGSPDPRVLPLWNKVDYSKGHKWGMSIDLNACTGCSACVVACQAENNISNVGKEQVQRGREMYWIRIDRYFSGNENDPETSLQPVACVQCEEAPCENVCPVNATVHSPEGLNDMAYNRCIGTRYCANNCPYKVRRFNYLNYNGDDGVVPDTEKMHFNPDVTVRMRGVMEKCTYCVQRIQETKIAAKRERRDIRDGEILTACAQACPAQAIVFGDLNDPKSQVGELAARDRGYHLLAELGTAPRTTYLGKLRNLNPEMSS